MHYTDPHNPERVIEVIARPLPNSKYELPAETKPFWWRCGGVAFNHLDYAPSPPSYWPVGTKEYRTGRQLMPELSPLAVRLAIQLMGDSNV